MAARFPSLVVVVAGGVILPACEAPQCGDSRADELQRHGDRGLRAAGDGRVVEGLREIGVALGVVSHNGTSSGGRTAGAAIPVNVVPPPPQISAPGAQAIVDPVPVQQVIVPTNPPPLPPQVQPPTTPTTRRGGAVRRVTPRPVPPVREPTHTAGAPVEITPYKP